MSDDRFEPRGMCWWLGLCSWWNPPKNMKGDFCIRCWKFKKYNKPIKYIKGY